MKKFFKTVCVSILCIFSLLVNFGCSCSKTMKAAYEINISNEDGSDTKPLLHINSKVTRKLRASKNTPCYKKVEAGYSQLTTNEEIKKCYNSDCYKKVGKKSYELITENSDIIACYENGNCYEKVEETYYKLIESKEAVSECYDAEGHYFERATNTLVEEEILEDKNIISSNGVKMNHSSEYSTLPKKEYQSLIFEFVLTNTGFDTIYIKEFNATNILEDQIKVDSMSKVDVKLPLSNLVINGENEYYKLQSNKSITFKIEINGSLNNSDVKDGKKDILLKFDLVVK